MIAMSLTFADKPAAIAALAGAGIAAKDPSGNAFIPTVASAPDGSRVDIEVAGGGSGIALAPTGSTQAGPEGAAPIPVYAPVAGFSLTLNWSGPNPPNFGSAANADVPAFIAAPVVPTPVPQLISDRQFFQQCCIQGLCSQAEALAAVQTGTLPSALMAAVNSIADPAQQFAAKMVLCGATQFDRNNPMTALLGALLGQTSAQMDAIWRAAALL